MSKFYLVTCSTFTCLLMIFLVCLYSFSNMQCYFSFLCNFACAADVNDSSNLTNNKQNPKLDGNFLGGCCVFNGINDGSLVCAPEMPKNIPPYTWTRFLARLQGAKGMQKIELHWPLNGDKSKSKYPGSKNLSVVLDRIINVSTDLKHWIPVENVDVKGQVARFTIDAGDSEKTLYISAGIPFLAINYEEVIAECKSCKYAKVEKIASTTRGEKPVYAVRIGPDGPGNGMFYIQGYQHPNEWAGASVASAMIRYLLSKDGAELRKNYIWRIVPVMNVGHLYNNPTKGDMNRDWAKFTMNETVGVREYIKRCVEDGERLLYAIDLHMGWNSREKAASCLTAGIKGGTQDKIVDQQLAFSKYVFANCDWATDRDIWMKDQNVEKYPSAAAYFMCEYNIPAQTGEFSRHLVWDHVSKQWIRISQEHEERLGCDLVKSIASFQWVN